MKKSVLASIMLLFFGGMLYSQSIPQDSLYLGQTPPGNNRKIFSLDTDPGYTAVEKIAISPDGDEIYYEETNSNWTSYKFRYYKYYNNTWNGPFDFFNNYYCLSISPDGTCLYFENNYYNDCWISVRQDTSWNPPSRFLKNFNVHSLNFTNLGNYYLSSNPEGGLGQRDICKLIVENSDTLLVGLGLPVNSGSNEGDFFISNDESFMIIMSNRSGGYGGTDLYISYRKNNDTWTNPKNLGTSVNTSGDDFGPYVTTDKKYLFYESGYSGPSSIYWVKVDGLIDSLMYTNYVPYLKNPIPDQTTIRGQLFSFTIPDSTFVDDDGNNTLTYYAKLTNGNPLPSWLSFDSISGAFWGTPDSLQVLHVKTTATDTAGASASGSFFISVEDPSASEQKNDQKKRIQIYPNPTNGLVSLSLVSFKDQPSFAEITCLDGSVIKTDSFKGTIRIDLSARPHGVYIVRLFLDKEILVGKICIE